MKIYKLIEAKDKAFLVIESCISADHLKIAQIYIDRFKEKFGDLIYYSILQRLINNKHNKLK